MCGIVGYAGFRQAAPIVLEGLSKLEYRGYDSAGLCVHDGNGLHTAKCKGRLQTLFEKTGGGKQMHGGLGIGHTRWATHGAPNDINSHPHSSASGKISLVHNGIIENEAVLRQWLLERGITFCSETDTEVISNLIGYFYEQSGDFLGAVRQALPMLEGSYALAVLCSDEPHRMIAARKASPLIFAFGEGEFFVASDVTAILSHTRTVTYVQDGELVLFGPDSVTFLDENGNPIQKEPEQILWEQSAAQRGGYAHFMHKEIMEQPKAIRDTLRSCLRDGQVVNVELTEAELRQVRKIYFVACGSAYYVSVIAKYTLEKLCRIPTEAVMASEFRYCDPIVDENTLVILISQSGETADTLAALKEAKARGGKTLAVVNVVGSAIARLADRVIYTMAGPEIAVATTKAFSSQLAVVYLLGLYMARQLGYVRDTAQPIRALEQLPEAVEQTLQRPLVEACQSLAKQYSDRNEAFFIGRNLDSAVCLEGSLKLKEVAYLRTEAYPAGELKHGPISLIEEGTLVVAVNTVEPLFDKTMANIREVKARGAQVLCITTPDKAAAAGEVADHCICVPKVHPMLQQSLNLLPLQLFSYFMAIERGCDVDKPRNLAKSVTVE